MKTKMIAIVLLYAAMAFSACANNSSSEPTTQTNITSAEAKSGVQLPAFKMVNASGELVDLQSFKGKKVFVNLWASWCPPCRREMPSIEKLYRSIDTSKSAFVMLALDDNFEKSRQYIQSQKLNLPAYYPAENLPELFNVPGIPATFIFDEQGKLIEKVEGGDDYNTEKYRQLFGG